ncbi:hypothetical protein GCM10011583_66690 [Streptomyces camponoticapitis]|uniref:Uncharacterized protein n=1 Tax=Streptomyces camponoticapitis TaxID=1616125 RepID=A0ABQ2EWA8_9ACTN|nr:hypothetical protein [Streptomyces camponoticapitis]GGK25362.1 hypothetical protein GCM10011583_66690 [Streptomyces camponoticapitis]
MNRLDNLASLDLRSLSEILASRAPAVPELGRGEWLGVLELMTMRLTDECGSLSVESWVTCSLAHEYALEAAMVSGSIDQRESVIRRLHLSVALLQQVPPNAEVGILNPSHLLDLLFQELPMSAEEARDLSVDWRALDIGQIRLLRAVKNLISPALGLVRVVPREEGNGRLRAWEEVFPSLP